MVLRFGKPRLVLVPFVILLRYMFVGQLLNRCNKYGWHTGGVKILIVIF